MVGGAHFSTFDERQYTVHGDCSYVLTKVVPGLPQILLLSGTHLTVGPCPVSWGSPAWISHLGCSWETSRVPDGETLRKHPHLLVLGSMKVTGC